MGQWPESDLSFSLNERPPQPQPSIAFFSVQSTESSSQRPKPFAQKGGGPDQGQPKDRRIGVYFVPPVLATDVEWTRQVKIEQKLIAKKLRGIGVEADVPWPVSSNVPGYKWFIFRDNCGRFYCFLFLARLSHGILARFYERLKEVVKEAADSSAAQLAVAQTINRFNDFTYRESLSDFIKGEDAPQSIDESKKETCITEAEKNRPKKKVAEPSRVKRAADEEAGGVEGKDMSSRFWQRHRRMFVMRLSVAFGISAAIFLCLVERFQTMRAERFAIY